MYFSGGALEFINSLRSGVFMVLCDDSDTGLSWPILTFKIATDKGVYMHHGNDRVGQLTTLARSTNFLFFSLQANERSHDPLTRLLEKWCAIQRYNLEVQMSNEQLFAAGSSVSSFD